MSTGLPCDSAGKKSACDVGDLGLVPGVGRSPRGGKGYPLQYSGLENSMDCIDHYGTPAGVPYSALTGPHAHTQQLLLQPHPSSCSPPPTALDPGQPPPTQATRWAPETLPPTHGKRLPMYSSFHWGWRAGGCTLDLGLAVEAWGGGSMCLSFLPNDNGIFIIPKN